MHHPRCTSSADLQTKNQKNLRVSRVIITPPKKMILVFQYFFSLCLWSLLINSSSSFSLKGWKQGASTAANARVSLSRKPSQILATLDPYENEDLSSTGRRKMLKNFGFTATAVCLPFGISTANAQVESPAVSSLSDLPPIPEDHVRIILCRHGQTENNRLKVVQGARLDPDINEYGRQQATRLGQAIGNTSPTPSHIYHSPLQRAKQTAEIIASQVKPPPATSVLSMIQEIDFGPSAEGASVDMYRTKMTATYARWSIGDVDAVMVEGGETGRDVLYRAQSALTTLRDLASSTENGCVAAVAHSAYIKVLLAVSNPGSSLASVSTLTQINCAANVLDVHQTRTRIVGNKDALFGGSISVARNMKLVLPEAKVVRINETRHLGDLAL